MVLAAIAPARRDRPAIGCQAVARKLTAGNRRDDLPWCQRAARRRPLTNVQRAEKAAVLARIGAAAYVGDTPADMQAVTTAGADVFLTSLPEFPAWYDRLRRHR